MKSLFPTYKHFLAIFGFYLLFSLASSLLVMVFPKTWMAFSIFLSYVISMGLTVWAVKRTYNKKYRFDFTPRYLFLLPFVVIAAYAFLIIGEFTVYLLPEPTGWLKEFFDKMNETFAMLMEHKIWGFLTIVVAAPLFEEMLFRGIILRALLKKTNPWKAIVITAVVFGLFHGNPWQFLYATVVGILLGYLFWKTRNLFYPVLVHMILNGTAFMAAVFFKLNPNEGLSDMTEKPRDFYILVAFSFLIVYVLYRYFENYFKQQQTPLILATQNKHKIDEIKKILPAHIKLQSLTDLKHKGELKETADTLQANAMQKLRQISIPYDVDAMADDTGLEVEALNGAPGVYSARYAGNNPTYEDNVNKLLQEMQDVENRKARFRTVIALSIGSDEKTFEGIINGTIATEPKGERGFGYDSVFIPEGETRTFAEMTDEEKNAISHRAKALQKLKEFFDTVKMS